MGRFGISMQLLGVCVGLLLIAFTISESREITMIDILGVLVPAGLGLFIVALQVEKNRE